jgi:hypothetical protein
VKFECTSTYPRLTFIIKFIPILKGISIIHMYSQKKLSRMTENSEQHIISKVYKEIDILYGSEVKNNNNIEFRYTEPKKLQDIEKFFIEFYISIRNNSDIFHDINHELKYFDFSIITTINEILINHKQQTVGPTNIDVLIQRINTKLYENYLNMKMNGAGERQSIDMDYEKLEKEKEVNGNNSNFLLINKEYILRELFKHTARSNQSSKKALNQSQLGSEYEVINTNGNKYMKDKDGWLLRDDERHGTSILNQSKHSTNTLKRENTLILSKIAGDAERLILNKELDNSLDLINKISIIQTNDDESSIILFNNKITNELKEENSDRMDSLIQQFNNKENNENIINTSKRNEYEGEIPKHNMFGMLVKKSTTENEKFDKNEKTQTHLEENKSVNSNQALKSEQGVIHNIQPIKMSSKNNNFFNNKEILPGRKNYTPSSSLKLLDADNLKNNQRNRVRLSSASRSELAINNNQNYDVVKVSGNHQRNKSFNKELLNKTETLTHKVGRLQHSESFHTGNSLVSNQNLLENLETSNHLISKEDKVHLSKDDKKKTKNTLKNNINNYFTKKSQPTGIVREEDNLISPKFTNNKIYN